MLEKYIYFVYLFIKPEHEPNIAFTKKLVITLNSITTLCWSLKIKKNWPSIVDSISDSF